MGPFFCLEKSMSKTFIVCHKNNRVFVYDTFISRDYEESQVIASVVSNSNDIQDILDANKLAIKTADLFDKRMYKNSTSKYHVNFQL